MFDRTRNYRVCNPRRSPGKVVLAVREALTGRVLDGVVGSDATACIVEGTKLDRHTSADTDEWGEGSLVESERAFGFIYLDGGV